jgi:hypothetical protein
MMVNKTMVRLKIFNLSKTLKALKKSSDICIITLCHCTYKLLSVTYNIV